MDTAREREREIVGGNLFRFKKNLKQGVKLKIQFLGRLTDSRTYGCNAGSSW